MLGVIALAIVARRWPRRATLAHGLGLGIALVAPPMVLLGLRSWPSLLSLGWAALVAVEVMRLIAAGLLVRAEARARARGEGVVPPATARPQPPA